MYNWLLLLFPISHLLLVSAAQGGKTVQQDRQELGETDVQGPRHPRRCQLLCRGRGPEGCTPSYAGAARDVPEVVDRLPGEEAVHVPKILLRLRSFSPRDPGTGFGFSHNSGGFFEIERGQLLFQAHLKSIFDNIQSVKFHDQDYNKILAIQSSEREEVPLDRPVFEH